jgi:cytochrome P450
MGTSSLEELINHPIMMEKAGQEIDSVVGRSRLVQESDIANLPYLQAIVKETLRLHPSGPLIVRESLEDCTISGYKIPAKTDRLLIFGHLEGIQITGKTHLILGHRDLLVKTGLEIVT